MRRLLFGTKKQEKQQPPPKSPPTPSLPPKDGNGADVNNNQLNDRDGRGGRRGEGGEGEGVGLGLGLPAGSTGQLRSASAPAEGAARRSKHVNFLSSVDSLPEDTGGGQRGRDSSSEGTHPNSNNSKLANCFPRSNSEQLESQSEGGPCTTTTTTRPTRTSTFPSNSSIASQAQARNLSPLSFASSSTYNPLSSQSFLPHPSLQRLAERGVTPDGTQILAPVTWSEMAHEDLVSNLGERERTRQEILWEVVASEERYVMELRSLVQHYVNPLLHPHSSNSSPTPSPSFPPPRAPSQQQSPYLSPSSHRTSSPNPSNVSQSELPIAAKFSRSASGGGGGGTTSSSSEDGHGNNRQGGSGAGIYGLNQPHHQLPEIDSEDLLLQTSFQNLPRSLSSTSLTPSLPPSSQHTSTRLYSLPFRPRHPLKPPPSTLSTKLHKSAKEAPKEVREREVEVPEGLRRCLESVEGMLKGHEELSRRLKEQWAKAFPLVRGLAQIWSDQPWFLDVYASYILSLEETLSTIDYYLPSNHSTNNRLLSPFSKSSSSSSSSSSKSSEKRFCRLLMSLEERAALSGEPSLAISISKPLMRLGKLPLLMQSLLWNTDATTMEFERTRQMALEVDALVRSIEDERVEEDERELVRDVMARIEGIKDKALMAPRSSRVLIEELPASSGVNSLPSPTPPSGPAPRRAVSDVAPSKSNGKQIDGKKSVKRLSDVVRPLEREKGGGKKEWLIRFSDVTIRCVCTGTTDVPGGFDRVKEKQGKQGKTKKKGKRRNLYRFVRVERWEMREATSSGGMVSMEDIQRVRRMSAGHPSLAERSEDEDEEEDDFDTVSRMSFTYDQDNPKPIDAPRDFKNVLRPSSGPRVTGRSVSATTRSVMAKENPAKAKFGTRLPATSAVNAGRYASPTAASLNRVTSPLSKGVNSQGGLGTRASSVPPRSTTPMPGGKRPSAPPTTTSTTMSQKESTPLAASDHNKMASIHSRDNSTLGVYDSYWSSPELDSVPFPQS